MRKLLDVAGLCAAQDEANKPIYNIAGQDTGCNFLAAGIDVIVELIRHGQTAHYVTEGAWSHWQLIDALINYLGTCSMLASSYAMSENAVRMLSGLKDSGKLKNLQCVIDNRIETRTAGSLQLLRNVADRLCLTACHAKVTVLFNDQVMISVIGSANYTENKRIEVGMVTTDNVVAQIHSDWILQTLNTLGT